jgi:MFS family permease|tara:strand:- start:30 stop:623 length:594 start_codon:yes stop_codon:yes gene_type:complete
MPAGGSQLDRRIVPMAVAYGLFGFGYVITMTFISAIARQTPAIAAIEPYIWFVVGVAALPSAAFWLWIGRRFGNPTSFALASLIEAMGVAATVLFTDASLVLVGAVLTGGTVVGILALGLSVARDFAQSSGIDPRRIIAIMTCAFGLGQVIGPAFAGYVADITGTFTVPTLVATATLLLAAALGLVVRKQAPGNLRT